MYEMPETMARTEIRTERPDFVIRLRNYIYRVTKPLNSYAFQGFIAWRIVTITLSKIKQNYIKNFPVERSVFIDEMNPS